MPPCHPVIARAGEFATSTEEMWRHQKHLWEAGLVRRERKPAHEGSKSASLAQLILDRLQPRLKSKYHLA